MSENDLYFILGISKKAKGPAIKTAYRKAAAQAHPDAGGSTAAFMRVRQAYEVLSDPERRKRYDATGVWDKTEVDNARQQMLDMLAVVFNAAIDHGIAFDKSKPLIDEMKKVVADQRERAQEAVDNGTDFIKSLETLKKRISRKDEGDNVFVKMAEERLWRARKQLGGNTKTLKAAEKCIDELAMYDSAVEAIRHVSMWQFGPGLFGSASTSTTGGF